ncbi:hypothetical protein LDC_2604 [sediment metagenome]|uniref:Uncharacterized protein n=1 Tax=sediment metagenome TaxID=749907 RepID=D9PM26_9ZZZZ
MPKFSYSCGKEFEGEYTYLPYLLEVTVRLPAEELWKEVEQSVIDAKKGWLWATQYSQPHVDELPVRQGCDLHVDYQVPNLRDPKAPPIPLTYDYVLAEWKPEEMFYRYEGKGRHPFRGSGFVNVVPIDAGSCLLKWGGRYHFKTGDKKTEGVARGSVKYFFTFLMAVVDNIEKKTGW